MYEELNLLSISHILTVITCFGFAILFPRLLKNSTEKKLDLFKYSIVSLIILNQIIDFFKEGTEDWRFGLPLHLCDFSSISIAIYLITGRRMFFVFAFFYGIAGAGMSILTPDVIYGFPELYYLHNQIGHMLIILGIFYGLIINQDRPYLNDIWKILLIGTVFLFFIYIVNDSFGTNYWFTSIKPIGDNVTTFMRPEPYHMIDLYILAVVICYIMYIPYALKDRKAKIV